MSKPCHPDEIALKSFFLGPQAENAAWVRAVFDDLLSKWYSWRKQLFPEDGSAISFDDQTLELFTLRRTQTRKALKSLVSRYESEIPQFSPRYLGHMFSEVSLPSLFGHFLTLLHNPNNISGESSRTGIQIEAEAIHALSNMVGFPQKAIGHFTSGGTIANFESILRARTRADQWTELSNQYDRSLHARGVQRSRTRDASMGWELLAEVGRNELPASVYSERSNPRPSEDGIFLIPAHHHYSWKKGLSLFGIRNEQLKVIELDSFGRADLRSIRSHIEKAIREDTPILMIVSVFGTTEVGALDPILDISLYLEQLKEVHGLHIYHHVDAAYGGFFSSLGYDALKEASGENAANASRALQRVTSITLDPHKLGYTPYAAGTFIARDVRDYACTSSFESPYLDFENRIDTFERGLHTLEGSRSATGAAATWMTAKTIGFEPSGFGKLLRRTIEMRIRLALKLRETSPFIRIVPGLETNILAFTIAKECMPIEESNKISDAFYQTFSPRKTQSRFVVSKTNLLFSKYSSLLQPWTQEWNAVRKNEEGVLVLRLCLLNPFFDSQEMNVCLSDEFARVLGKWIEKHVHA